MLNHIRIQWPDGSILPILLQSDATSTDVQNMLRFASGPNEVLRLVFNDLLLHDDTPMFMYGLKDGDIIQAVIMAQSRNGNHLQKAIDSIILEAAKITDAHMNQIEFNTSNNVENISNVQYRQNYHYSQSTKRKDSSDNSTENSSGSGNENNNEGNDSNDSNDSGEVSEYYGEYYGRNNNGYSECENGTENFVVKDIRTIIPNKTSEMNSLPIPLVFGEEGNKIASYPNHNPQIYFDSIEEAGHYFLKRNSDWYW